MEKVLTLGSLFDGIGGFPLAGVYAGMKPLWASEIEPFPIRVTTKRFPEMKHCGDIHKLNGFELEPVDLITFGSPCQNLSVAGKRTGLQGEQSSLFFEAVRIIKEMRESTNGMYPRWVCWENVPGALSSASGRDFCEVLSRLLGICEAEADVPMPENGKWLPAGEIMGDHCSVAWRILDAAQGWGVAQRRKRIFVVLDLTGTRAGKVLFESEGLSGYTPPSSQARKGVAQGTSGSIGATGEGISASGFCTEHSADSRGIGYEEERSPTLRAGVVPGIAIDFNPTASRIGMKKDGICQTLTARCGTGGNTVPLTLTAPIAYGISSDQSNGMLSDNPHAGIYEADTSRTLDCSGGNPVCNQGGIAVVEPIAFAQNQRDEVRNLGEQSGTVSASPVIHQQTYVAQPVYTLRPRINTEADEEKAASLMARDYKDPIIVGAPAYCMTVGSFCNVAEEKTPTLEARGYKDPPVVGKPTDDNPKMDTYAMDRACFTAGENAQYRMNISEEVAPTLVAEGPAAVTGEETQYLVRRLTPLECCRLQGYPDGWTENLGTMEPTEQEIAWWSEVFKEWYRVQGKKSTAISRNRVIKWLKDPHTDSAEYKAYGNSVAVPCVYFVLAGIVWVEGLEP